jgi:carboxymethylenebutenolidase
MQIVSGQSDRVRADPTYPRTDEADNVLEDTTVCFTPEARPPIPPIAGGALDSRELTLIASDGNRLAAFEARAAEPGGAGIIVLPDVRGLHAYYRELALRFAEAGVDAVAIDYFGRTAKTADRGADFEYMPHVSQTTFAGLSADATAAAEHLRSSDRPPRSLFTVGFCFGGRIAFVTATLGLDLAGVIGFYGVPLGAGRNDVPAPVDVADRFASPVLGLFGGDDRAIPQSSIAAFETALGKAGVEHRIISYPGAPHSFFDRTFEEHAAASADAWQHVLGFIATNTAAPAPAFGSAPA